MAETGETYNAAHRALIEQATIREDRRCVSQPEHTDAVVCDNTGRRDEASRCRVSGGDQADRSDDAGDERRTEVEQHQPAVTQQAAALEVCAADIA